MTLVTSGEVCNTSRMRITRRFTYQGGPLAGQTALPTSVRGQQYTIFRDATGAALRTENGDRWGRAETAGRKHPGYYSRSDVESVDTSTLTVSGTYIWTPAREKKADA